MRDSLSLRRNLVLRLLETTGTFRGGLTALQYVQEFMGVRSGCGLNENVFRRLRCFQYVLFR